MGRLFIATISYIAVFAITIIAFLFNINGYKTLDISMRLPVILTPATYAYVFVLLLNILLAYWLFQYWRKLKSFESMTLLQASLFVIANILQIVEILSWHHLQYTISIVSLSFLLATLAALYFTYPYDNEFTSNRMPIAIYFAWTIFIFMTNISFILTLNEWNGFGLSYQLWAVIAMTFGTAIAMHVRYHFYDVTFPSVFIWAYVAVAVHNSFDELLVTTAALFLSGVMIVGIIFMKKNSAPQN